VRGDRQLLDKLLVPRDPRGIVLLCGFIGAVALGVSALTFGDPLGYAYLAAAAIGYFFLQTRLVPTVLWLLIGFGGMAGASAGNTSDWVVFGLALVLAIVSLLPPPQGAAPETSRKLEEPASNGQFNGQLNGHLPAETSRKLEVSPSPSAVIRTIGRLRLEVGGRDVTARLNEQPRLEFLLSYLLARAVRGGDPSIDRSALADEVAPGISLSSRRDRLRKQLYALQATLGTELKGLLRVNNTHVSLDLTGVEMDVISLAELSRRVAGRRSLIDANLADEIRHLLEETAGREFLSGFSELEQQVTAGRGTAGQVVDEARLAVVGWRADLVKALAEYLVAAGQPQASIAFLVAALAQTEERQDLARLLVAAYLQTGQTARASEARLQYELTEEK